MLGYAAGGNSKLLGMLRNLSRVYRKRDVQAHLSRHGVAISSLISGDSVNDMASLVMNVPP